MTVEGKILLLLLFFLLLLLLLPLLLLLLPFLLLLLILLPPYQYHTQVETKASKGDIVAILCATDADSPSNGGPFTFTQSQTDKNFGVFRLDRVRHRDYVTETFFGVDGRSVDNLNLKQPIFQIYLEWSFRI